MLCGRSLILENVLYAPGIIRNLISVMQLMNVGFSMSFENSRFSLFLNNVCYGSGHISDGFVVLDLDPNSLNKSSFSYIASSSSKNKETSKMCHTRLSHIGQEQLVQLAKAGLLGNLSNVELPTCKFCLKGKLVRKPFGKMTRGQYPLQLIRSDVAGEG